MHAPVLQLLVEVEDDVLLRGFAGSHCEVGGLWFGGQPAAGDDEGRFVWFGACDE